MTADIRIDNETPVFKVEAHCPPLSNGQACKLWLALHQTRYGSVRLALAETDETKAEAKLYRLLTERLILEVDIVHAVPIRCKLET